VNGLALADFILLILLVAGATQARTFATRAAAVAAFGWIAFVVVEVFRMRYDLED
jgi:hypothetical protein